MKSQSDYLLHLFGALCHDLDLPSRDVLTIYSRCACEGINFLTGTLPLLAKALLHGLESGKFCCPTNFSLLSRRGRKSRLPSFLGFAFSRIFDHEGMLLQDPDIVSINTIRQVCEYAYKLDIPYKERLNDLVVENFVSTEADVSTFSFESDDPLLLLASRLTSAAFGDFHPDCISPKHGPGATSNCRIEEKYEHKLAPNLAIYRDFGKLFFFGSYDGVTRLDRYPTSNTFDLFRSEVRARVVLVPKDSRGPRLISAEPVEHQYIQQGIASWMVDRIESYPLSSGQVNFTDQSVNQDLARRSSISREYSTLDLKDASDRNSLSLFQHLFGRIPPLMDAILACRTSKTELPDGTILDLSKFAPMGSALCFPVMAWTIYSLLLSGFILSGESVDIREHIFVYGDDIVVPNRLNALSIEILQRYGFAVNTQKSYSSGFFRESCGGDFYCGVNVTPQRVRKLSSSGNDRKRLAFELLTHGNQMPHFPSVQEICWDYAEAILGQLPYSGEAKPYLSKLVSSNLEAYYLNRRQSAPVFWRVKPLKIRSRKPSEYGHFLRVHRSIGNPNCFIQFGIFDAPRRWNVVRTRKRNLRCL